MYNNPEILAPAGGFESVKAAVACGADAVYLGTKTLNARRNAENFSDEQLAEIVSYCHIRGVKVYLTLNTIVLDSELDDAVNAVKNAALSGIDALIVQDLSIVSIVKQASPDLRLHGSTQMSVHNLDGAKVLEKLGFSRVVLARELSKNEIEYIAKNTSLEVEVFVHGALCMSVSGQCYLSSIIGERSGNRGLCAQPCRLPFKTKGSEFALSLKDMSLIKRIDELKEIGVKSVKIEGRMKRPEYVAAAVTACKAAVNGEYVDFESLRAVFSRSGFTDGYFDGRLTADMFGIRQKDDVVSAAPVLSKLEALYRNEVTRIPVVFDIFIRKKQPSRLICTDCDGNCATVEGEIPQLALNKPTDKERIAKSLNKTGSTAYYAEKINYDIDSDVMMPVSLLNSMRRDALENLDKLRGKIKPVEFVNNVDLNLPRSSYKKDTKIRARLCRADQLTDYIINSSELIVMPAGELIKAAESGRISNIDKFAAELPRADFTDCSGLRKILEKLYGFDLKDIYANNIYAIETAAEYGFKIHGGFGLNIANSLALQMYMALGLSDAVLSFELSLSKANNIADIMPKGIIAYGYLPLMMHRNCPIKHSIGCDKCKRGYRTITDRMGNSFAVSCEYGGYSELYNFVPLYLADRLDELKKFDFIVLHFTKEDSIACEDILRQYIHGGEFKGEKTRGLYYRNII